MAKRLDRYCAFILVALVGCALLSRTPTTREESLQLTSIPSSLELALKRQDPLQNETSAREGLVRSLEQSLSYFKKNPEQNHLFGSRSFKAKELISAYESFLREIQNGKSGEELYNYVTDRFDFYGIPGKESLITGYYEATLNGSRRKTPRFKYPIYQAPKDLLDVKLNKFLLLSKFSGMPDSIPARLGDQNSVVPYLCREDIDFHGALAGKRLEIAWVDDPVALFFLHVQGSGVIDLAEGGELRVGFSAKNGQPYRSIGAYLAEKEGIPKDQVSMQTIKDFLVENPHRMREVLSANPSYVFFRETKGGPYGNIGVPLVPYRSIATDSALFPKGALAFLDSTINLPVKNGPRKDGKTKTMPFQRIVLNQDTGGAIKGSYRVDLFTGRGTENEGIAGNLRNQGRLWFLAPKS